MQQAGVLVPRLAPRLRGSFVGLRNRPVHADERIDNRSVCRTAGRPAQAGRGRLAAAGARLAAIPPAKSAPPP